MASFISLLSCSLEPDRTDEKGKPNILLIVLDDIGKEWVSSYGAEGVSTPSIDSVARDGIRFDNVWSNPQCTPTRLSLLTGQYPFRHGWVNHWDVPRWGHGYFDWRLYPSLAGTLKRAGYATAAAGKWQINDFRIEPEAMRKHGFDSFAMWTGFETGVPASAERYWNPYIHTESGSRTYPGEFGTDVFVEHLIDFITEHRSEPWFAYFPLALPHPPYVSPPGRPELSAEDDEAQYRAMVEYADTAIGRLVAHIDGLDLSQNSLIIVTADNGSPGSRYGRIGDRTIQGGKSRTSESGINVPFVVRWPASIQGGQTSNVLVDFTDLLPTFAELAGTDVTEDFVVDGQSFASYLRGETSDGPKEWIMSMGGGNNAEVSNRGIENQYVFRDRVIRDKRFKLYIGATPDRTPLMLFDLLADPNETKNLLGGDDPEVLDAVRRLQAIAASFPDRDNDPQYTRRPPNAWDVQTSVDSQVWKR